MQLFEFTRKLIDIESITGNEENVCNALFAELESLAIQYGGRVERIPVEPRRDNLFAYWGEPVVTFSTHIDTVPPFFPSREDDDNIWGRGACDTKGIIASMIEALRGLLENGVRNLAMLLVVGEERNSIGAYTAGKQPRGSKYIINGEPTENRLALGSKGALRFEIVANGRMAHSAYPELGDSAVNKLLDALAALRALTLPVDPVLGPSTINIGTLQGGRAPNVIADYAKAEVFIRLVDDGASTRPLVLEAVKGMAEAQEVLCIPALRLGALDGFETTVVAYTTDIPAFAGNWGQPFLLGPGTIHVAHTDAERVPKAQLLEAVEIYRRLARQLLNNHE